MSQLCGLLDWCKLLGLEVVCAGKSGEGNYAVDPVAETIHSPGNSWGKTGDGQVHVPGLGALWDIGPDDVRPRAPRSPVSPPRLSTDGGLSSIRTRRTSWRSALA